ncbi:MAG: hypothetical protein A3J49_02290 [Gallionellales bacterium RIFCSPHIGHO2_02_FULL_57_16]|nr:MAG: hypothetical protein A3J49_02290 [Gallionellales bacterium RIFCSPHIGHO2_02_FULL_57_16]
MKITGLPDAHSVFVHDDPDDMSAAVTNRLLRAGYFRSTGQLRYNPKSRTSTILNIYCIIDP